MQTRRALIFSAVAIALLVITFAFTHSPIGDLRSRIEHEHGLCLPPSAASLECRGDAGRGFLDRGASSAFVIAPNELVGFISQLKIQPGYTTFISGNSQYQLRSPWRTGKPITTYSCSSPVGDWLHVEV